MATKRDQNFYVPAGIFEEPTETKETKETKGTGGKEIAPVRELTSQERDMVNFTRMLLESKVPSEVLLHDNYLGISLFTLGSTDVDRMHLPVEELKKKAIANAVVLLQGAHSLESDKMHFILTPSTSASGPEGIEPFTLRCAKKDGNVVSVRLVYNRNLREPGWQILRGSTVDYSLLSKARVYPSLEKVISGCLANAEELPSDCVGITKEAFEVKRRVVLNDQEIEVPNLTLRGLCKAADIFSQEKFSQELGDEAPFILPSSVCSNATFTACFNNLLYGLPFEMPAESGQKRAFLQEVTNLARFLECSQLEAELAPLRIQADAHFVQASEEIVARSRLKEGEFILTEYRNKPVPTLLCMKVGAEIVEKLIEVDSKGAYIVSGSTQSYADHNRLIRDIRQTEELAKLLEGKVHLQDTQNLMITPTNNHLSYPVRQHEVCVTLGSAKVFLPITLKADSTFTVGGVEGLPSFGAVEKALKTQCGAYY